MSNYIDEVFGPDGIMATHFPGYEPRAGQLNMARAVDGAIAANTHLVVEAATGVGKSRAALVPAIYHAVHNRRGVLVVTANIALQEQYVTIDLPALKSELPWPFTFALLKGCSNYVCKDRLAAVHADDSELQATAKREKYTEALVELLHWCDTTTTGDVSEAGAVPPGVLALLTVGADRCKGSKVCKHAHACFANRARDIAEQADIIVANYHLLFADIVVREESNGNAQVLPDVSVVIADEAHRAADVARVFFGSRFSRAAVHRLVTDTLRTMREAGMTVKDAAPMDALEREADTFFDVLLRLRRSKDYDTRLRAAGVFDADPLARALFLFDEQLKEFAHGNPDSVFNKLRKRVSKHRQALLDAFVLADKNSVYYIEENNNGRGARAVLCSMPIRVADKLRTGLFDAHTTVVCMSATMAVGSSFAHFCDEVGCDDAPTRIVTSPFDLTRQALFVVPAGLPAPNESAYRTAVPEFTSKAIAQARGRTLGLFTTWKNLLATAELLRRDGTAERYRVLVQGEAPRTDLVEAFRKDTSSVLLGTASFWEGVDVRGEALSCVVIDRLPFSSPDDPIANIITETDPRGWFENWSKPRAVIAFRQGFGRLIRSTQDSGVVVCLDRRLVDKSYGKTFLRVLGGVRLARDIDDVGRFFAEVEVEQ